MEIQILDLNEVLDIFDNGACRGDMLVRQTQLAVSNCERWPRLHASGLGRTRSRSLQSRVEEEKVFLINVGGCGCVRQMRRSHHEVERWSGRRGSRNPWGQSTSSSYQLSFVSGKLFVGDGRIVCHLLSHHRVNVRRKTINKERLKAELVIRSTEAERLDHQRRCELCRRLAGLHLEVTEGCSALSHNFIGGVDIEESVWTTVEYVVKLTCS